MKAYGTETIQCQTFLTSTLCAGKSSTSNTGHFFTLGERAPSTHWRGDYNLEKETYKNFFHFVNDSKL
jgi:hypothetical protein